MSHKDANDQALQLYNMHKTKYQSFLSEDNIFKFKGELFCANIRVSYYIPIASLLYRVLWALMRE